MNKDIIKSIKKGEVLGIIPARSGSKGVPNKNIRCIHGYPLIAYSIAIAKMSSSIDRVIVSTDSEEYAKVARYYGAEVPFLRPAELANDQSTDIEFVEHAIQWLYENENSVPEYLAHLRPTYPWRELNVVDEAIRLMKADDTATSLRSAHKAEQSPFKWFRKSNDGYYLPMFDDMTLDDANKPRQIFPDVFIPDGYMDVLRVSHIVEKDLVHGDKMIGYVVDDGIDVDSMRDFSNLEKMTQGKTVEVLEYLKANFKPLEEANL